MNYSIVIPVYNEEKNIETLHNELVNVLERLNENRNKFEIIYINDGSTDNTLHILQNLIVKKFDLKILNNKKNLSQSVSLYNGINVSNYDNLIFLDGDGQNNPFDIFNLVEEFEKGFDLVHGYRTKRKDNFFYRTLPSLVANLFVRLISKSKIKDHGCALKIIKKKFLIHSKLWGDFHRLLAARLSNENIKVSQIPVTHRARKYGKSNYGYSRMFKVLIDLIYAYLFTSSTNNFYLIGYLGLISIIGSLLSFIYMLKLKLVNGISFIQTPLPTVTALCMISGLIFFSFMFIVQNILEIKNSINDFDNQKNYDLVEKKNETKIY